MFEKGIVMSKLILASHGSLAEGMKSALKMILGDTVQAEAFGLDKWEQPQAIMEQIQKLREEAPEEEFIILCDMKGGSVCNRMVELCSEPNVCVISGMNLTLAIGLAMMPPGVKCSEMKAELFEEARDGIEYFDSAVVGGLKEEEEDDLW
ncbi:MAG: hypothetical protein PHQ72_00830 [Hespellia sp.]|nr:hypothetical protein [Hespellia sp.]